MKIPKKDLWLLINDYSYKKYEGDSKKIHTLKRKHLNRLIPFFKIKFNFSDSFNDIGHPDEEKFTEFCNSSFYSWYLFYEGQIYFHREQDATLFLLKYGEHIA